MKFGPTEFVNIYSKIHQVEIVLKKVENYICKDSVSHMIENNPGRFPFVRLNKNRLCMWSKVQCTPQTRICG